MDGDQRAGRPLRGRDSAASCWTGRKPIATIARHSPPWPRVSGPIGSSSTPRARGELTLRLRRDDVPIEGRIIGLEGRPVPGLTVSVAYIAEFPGRFTQEAS